MKKKYVALLLAVTLMSVAASGAWGSYYNEGHYGLTESDAYIIDSVADMLEFRDRINGGKDAEGLYYKLKISLNLEQYTKWNPIGTGNAFKGHFDGNGNTIKVKIDSVVLFSDNYALFGTIKTESGYAVKNLNVSGTVGYEANAAGIALKLYNASIENCSFSGTIFARGHDYRSYSVRDELYFAYAGGIVEHMFSGTIKNCTVKNATIKANPYYVLSKGYPGGIVSRMAGGTIEGCTVDENTVISGVSQKGGTWDTQAGEVSAGGIVGILDKVSGNLNRGSVKNNKCYAQIEAKAGSITSVSAGGIIGEIGETNISIEGNTYKGDISGDPAKYAHVGGVIGKFTGSNVPTISNNHYSGAAYGIGYDAGGNVTDDPGCINDDKVTPPKISGTLANGVIKTKYSKTLTVSGGTAAYTWSKSSGTLPTGLKLTYSGTKATISGTPTKAGTFTFTIKVTDNNKATDTKSFTVKITQPEISGTLANGVIKTKYSKTLTVSGGTAAYTWSKSSGTLPTGLKLTYSGTKATLSGTPTKAGTFTFTIKVTDKNNVAVTKSFTVKITQPEISGTLANGTVKTKYSKTLTVSGGTAAYTWTKSSGTLPTGLKLTYSDTKATISGTPTKAGTFTFTIKVTDKNNVSATKSFTVKIANLVTLAISEIFESGAVKAGYSGAAKVSGGTAPYTWTKSSGTIPTGLKLTYKDSVAMLTGTPTKAGTFTFALKVTDKSKVSVTKSFTVKITQPEISWTFKNGTVKEAYTDIVMATGGTAPYKWTKSSGTIPTGLKLTYTDSLAVLSGTPTKAGTFTFALKVTDANKATVTKSFTVKIVGTSTSSKEASNKTNSQSEKTSKKNQSEQTRSLDEKQNSLPENSPEILDGEDTDVSLYTELKVVSEDIVEAYDGKDSDMVKVKAGAPLKFTVGDWGTEVDNVVVYVDDKAVNSVRVSGEGKFTLPAEVVVGDFKVSVKAQSVAGKRLESEELYMIAE